MKSHRRTGGFSYSTDTSLVGPVGIEPTTCGLKVRISEPIL